MSDIFKQTLEWNYYNFLFMLKKIVFILTSWIGDGDAIDVVVWKKKKLFFAKHNKKKLLIKWYPHDAHINAMMTL